MEEMFNDIIEKDEKILMVYKPNKKKFWWSFNLTILFSFIFIPFWLFLFCLQEFIIKTTITVIPTAALLSAAGFSVLTIKAWNLKI